LLEPLSLSKGEAPEESDDEVPLACCFSDALLFLGKSHEVQVQKYKLTNFLLKLLTVR